MRKLITNLVIVGVLVLGARFALNLVFMKRFLEQFDDCHAELHIGARLKAASTDVEVDAVLAEYRSCVKGKGNALDSLVNGKRIDETIAAVKEMQRRD